MSTVIYVRKGPDGRIAALSRSVPDDDPGWSASASDAPEVQTFIKELSGAGGDALDNSDLPFVRVLEDVIDILVDRAVIRFTDLPLPAQTKLLQRRRRRQQRQGLCLFSDEDPI
ncbi:MAG: hypothetical protein LBT71_06285 [Azoarcus sp.]|jgi:hypothetical protein|nr:hypothetical protein [Azoarcus sp.]